VTFAENCCCALAATWAVVGDTEILTDVADTIETTADADFAEDATEVALTVTCGVVGMTAGAV
jgi:hypothetical protein